MPRIVPIRDLKNTTAISTLCHEEEEPIFVTKNGYGTMVVMSIEAYSELTDNVERALDEADRYAEENPKRMTHEEVFSSIRERIGAYV